jgi:hypothetical protein
MISSLAAKSMLIIPDWSLTIFSLVLSSSISSSTDCFTDEDAVALPVPVPVVVLLN